jgi:hypothetical protein
MLKSSMRFGFYAATLTTLTFVSNMSPVDAASVIQDSNGNVTGINGLDVQGANYNVTFSSSSYNDLFEGTGLTPTFLGNETGAQSAVDAIIAAFNTLSPIPLGIVDPGALIFGAQQGVNVPFDKDPNQFAFLGGLTSFKSGWYDNPTQKWITQSFTGGQGSGIRTPQLAIFTANAAPIPTPALLPGLIGLGVAVRRRKQGLAKSV